MNRTQLRGVLQIFKYCLIMVISRNRGRYVIYLDFDFKTCCLTLQCHKKMLKKLQSALVGVIMFLGQIVNYFRLPYFTTFFVNCIIEQTIESLKLSTSRLQAFYLRPVLNSPYVQSYITWSWSFKKESLFPNSANSYSWAVT